MKLSEGFSMADSRNLPKVDYMMLMEYMRESDSFNMAEIRGAKALMSSRDSYVESAVGYVEVKRENGRCCVKGRVTPEHKVRNKAYSVIAVIDETKECLQKTTCEDCAASEGGCKHCICFVMWLIKRTEEPSVTTVTCYWTKPKLAESLSQDKFCYAKELGKRKTVTCDPLPQALHLPNFLQECKERKIKDSLILNYNSDIENLDKFTVFQMFLKFSTEKEDVTFDDFKMYCESQLTPEIVCQIEEASRSQAQSKFWHTIKQSRLSASKIHEATKCQTDGALVKQILGGYKVPETTAIKRGKKLESLVIKEVEKKLKISVKKCGFILSTPFIGASPDGITDEFTIEIKCPMSEKTMGNYLKENDVLPKYKAQVQLQMHAAGKKKGLFCVADPKFETNGIYHSRVLYYDKLYIEKLMSEGEKFWKSFIFNKMLSIAKV